jgi:putative Holliday junction resolvase
VEPGGRTVPSGRILGVDLGERRIGLAVSDPTGTLATPLGLLERSGDRVEDRRAILAAARDAGASRIVVGLPVALSGSAGPAARAVMAEVEALRAEAEDPAMVVTHDERLTTVIAEQGLRAAGVKGKQRRTRVDAAAATVLLQSYLDAAS